MTDISPYGYYGKLPMAGDFLRRRLSPEFTSAWDRWLQRIMVTARAHMGQARWSAAYPSAPIWRFSIAQGLLGPGGAAGIVMPSLDKVGRQFPFCIAAETDLSPLAANLALQPVADRLESLALAMLDEGAALTNLEGELATLPPPAMVDPEINPQTGSLWVAAGTSSPRVLCLPALPTNGPEAAALFDLQAPFWARPTRPQAAQ
jgi:type VI secretion system protein ImpM